MVYWAKHYTHSHMTGELPGDHPSSCSGQCREVYLDACSFQGPTRSFPKPCSPGQCECQCLQVQEFPQLIHGTIGKEQTAKLYSFKDQGRAPDPENAQFRSSDLNQPDIQAKCQARRQQRLRLLCDNQRKDGKSSDIRLKQARSLESEAQETLRRPVAATLGT